MFKNRLFNILIIAALIAVTALTIQQALETTKVVLAADIYGQHVRSEGSSLCEMPIVDRTSIHSVYVKQIGIWLPYSDSGPTGVDGGLIELLSNSRGCTAGKEQ